MISSDHRVKECAHAVGCRWVLPTSSDFDVDSLQRVRLGLHGLGRTRSTPTDLTLGSRANSVYRAWSQEPIH